MRKIFFSITFIATFGLYIFFERQNRALMKNTMPSPALSSEVVQTSEPLYKDGNYIGNVTDAYYGDIQVEAVIKNGLLSDVIFLKYPNDRPTSIQINEDAIPVLKTEAIKAQDATVDIISGATDSAKAFNISLKSALTQAQL